jgi:hypothetical protein
MPKGRELEYVFQADEPQGKATVTQEKAAEIAVNWVTVFYHVQVGAIETQEFKTSPIPHWLFRFRTRSPDRSNACFSLSCSPTGRWWSRKSQSGFRLDTDYTLRRALEASESEDQGL